MLSLFKRKNRAIAKWRSRAWSIDPKKTRLTIIEAEAPRRHVPPWIYKKYHISSYGIYSLRLVVFEKLI